MTPEQRRRREVLYRLFGSRVRVDLLLWLHTQRDTTIALPDVRVLFGSGVVHQLERLDAAGLVTETEPIGSGARPARQFYVETEGRLAEATWDLIAWAHGFINGTP